MKLFTPDAQFTWLLTELDPDGGLAFGLCDLGLDCPKLGYVSSVNLPPSAANSVSLSLHGEILGVSLLTRIGGEHVVSR